MHFYHALAWTNSCPDFFPRGFLQKYSPRAQMHTGMSTWRPPGTHVSSTCPFCMNLHNIDKYLYGFFPHLQVVVWKCSTFASCCTPSANISINKYCRTWFTGGAHAQAGPGRKYVSDFFFSFCGRGKWFFFLWTQKQPMDSLSLWS